MAQTRSKKRKTPVSARTIPQLDGWVALFVAALTLIVFARALNNEFVGWDDYELLLYNPRYRGFGWEQLRWMFTTFHMGPYQPLSWMSYAVDYLVWEMNPFGYHLTNLFVHAGDAALFYFVSQRLLSLAFSLPYPSKDPYLKAAAGFAAFFFAIHPLRVESVAWATERRDVLSGLFFLATLIYYLRAATLSDGAPQRRRWLGASLACYALALLSKAIVISLPVVLVILDIYPLRRIGENPKSWLAPAVRRIWWEKLPFFLLAFAAAVIAPLAQMDAGAVASLRVHGVAARIAQSFYGLAFYFWKTIFPIDLSPFYEVPPNLNPLAWPFLLSAAVILTISVALFMLRQRWPGAWTAWLCYGVTIAPVLGFFQSGRQMVADRYSYLACMAWAILAGGCLYYYLRPQKTASRDTAWKLPLVGSVAGVILAVLSILTWRQIGVWHDTDRLWHHVLAITDKSVFRSGTAHHLVGRFYSDRGDLDRALEHLRLSLEIEPTDATTYVDLGAALARQGKLDEAIRNLQYALSLSPNLSLAQFNLGNAYALQGRFNDAAEHLQDAIKIKPDYVEAYNNLGKVFAAQGQTDKAIDLFRRAVEIRPDFAEAHHSLAMALAEKGLRDEASLHFQEAQRIVQANRFAGAAKQP